MDIRALVRKPLFWGIVVAIVAVVGVAVAALGGSDPAEPQVSASASVEGTSTETTETAATTTSPEAEEADIPAPPADDTLEADADPNGVTPDLIPDDLPTMQLLTTQTGRITNAWEDAAGRHLTMSINGEGVTYDVSDSAQFFSSFATGKPTGEVYSDEITWGKFLTYWGHGTSDPWWYAWFDEDYIEPSLTDWTVEFDQGVVLSVETSGFKFEWENL